MGLAWALDATCMARVWDLYRHCMRLLHAHGTCTGSACDLYGMCTALAWALHATCMARVWGLHGHCVGMVLVLYGIFKLLAVHRSIFAMCETFVIRPVVWQDRLLHAFVVFGGGGLWTAYCAASSSRRMFLSNWWRQIGDEGLCTTLYTYRPVPGGACVSCENGSMRS